MGGKTPDSAPTTIDTSGGSSDKYLPMMMAMMANQQNQASQIPNAPVIPETPRIAQEEVEKVDWTAKQAELKEKVKGNFAVERARKKGLSSTVHTSPLLDEETIAGTIPKSTLTTGS